MLHLAPLTHRSLLFVPADNARLLEKAHQRSADAIILDLEDAVHPAAKPRARSQLGAQIRRLQALGADILVRINTGWRDTAADIEAAVQPGVSALMVPKAEDVGNINVISEMVLEWEVERNMVRGGIGLVPLIETPRGLAQLSETAGSPRLVALAFGSEDFSLALGVEPSAAVLALPCQQVAFAAAAHNVCALGLPGSLSEFSNLDEFSKTAACGRAIGMKGALCIHPNQVAIINQTFRPSIREIEWAKKVMAAWAEADAADRGTTSVDGRMVDGPVVKRAIAILARSTDSG